MSTFIFQRVLVEVVRDFFERFVMIFSCALVTKLSVMIVTLGFIVIGLVLHLYLLGYVEQT